MVYSWRDIVFEFQQSGTVKLCLNLGMQGSFSLLIGFPLNTTSQNITKSSKKDNLW